MVRRVSAAKKPAPQPRGPQGTTAQSDVRDLAANELIFGMVGPVGSGASEVAEALETLLKGRGYDVTPVLAREIIGGHAETPPNAKAMRKARALQDSGDDMRRSAQDGAAVALRMIGEIRKQRASKTRSRVSPGQAVEPDGRNRAYILDSLRNPAEVALLRHVYQDAFCLIGVVCREATRDDRLREKYSDASADEIRQFKERDKKSDDKLGQQVSDTFHLSDYFVDNSVPRLLPGPGKVEKPNPEWSIPDQVERLIDLLVHNRIVTPRPAETGMFHAWGAAMRSACLSRQVGAALMDGHGNVLATGTNEVPRAGGGVYGAPPLDGFDGELDPDQDFRCCSHKKGCSNVYEQIHLVEELLTAVPSLGSAPGEPDLVTRIRKTRVGQLIEFSRAVHAEMEALFSAARRTAGKCCFARSRESRRGFTGAYSPRTETTRMTRRVRC
ncbi:MAG: hypothetical protein HQL40_01365 [Alphaproteobacteria bacterium]|nr:hypothetical protein [Alphaproteobacteria bacterium]